MDVSEIEVSAHVHMQLAKTKTVVQHKFENA